MIDRTNNPSILTVSIHRFGHRFGAVAVIAAALLLTLWSSASLAECTPGTGPNACAANSTRCLDDKRVQLCNPETCVWDKIMQCVETETCSAGACVAPTKPAPSHPTAVPRENMPKASRPPHSCHDGEGFYNDRMFNPATFR